MSEINKRKGTTGWKSMLAVKDNMVCQYRIAQRHSKNKHVQVSHGNVAEAAFREVLTNFLPKRYGVTSGYVVSQKLQPSIDKLSHFDIIIFDQLESPILWIEGNPDSSSMGLHRGIPVEYIVSIIEVKSSFEPKTAKDAIKKLHELEPFLKGMDEPNEQYKKYLPPNFCSSIIFLNCGRNIRQ